MFWGAWDYEKLFVRRTTHIGVKLCRCRWLVDGASLRAKDRKMWGAREVLASHYRTGTKTASGERFNPLDLTAASHDYPLGTTITAMNPLNGRSCLVRINDRGPYGIARQMGVRIDFALGAARCLGMHSARYICAP
jgi:rare lipoprotein A (peptidoglycan hydrolase)